MVFRHLWYGYFTPQAGDLTGFVSRVFRHEQPIVGQFTTYCLIFIPQLRHWSQVKHRSTLNWDIWAVWHTTESNLDGIITEWAFPDKYLTHTFVSALYRQYHNNNFTTVLRMKLGLRKKSLFDRFTFCIDPPELGRISSETSSLSSLLDTYAAKHLGLKWKYRHNSDPCPGL